LVEHSLGKGEVISSILIIGSKELGCWVTNDGVIGVMTGPWLIVKWAGVGVLLFYLLLLIHAMRRYRDRLSGMRAALFMPIVIGNFVSLTLPWIFMKAEVTRICFVVAQAIFMYGITVLVRKLTQRDQTGLLRADS
jgi:hypothetical protein